VLHLDGDGLAEGPEGVLGALAHLLDPDGGHLGCLRGIPEPVADAAAERHAASVRQVGEGFVDLGIDGDREADTVVHGGGRKW
jgi:hypothetical protein